MWRMAGFCSVRLVTYCVMGNYFHALVEVPKREIWLERFAGPAGEEKLLEHLLVFYSKTYVGLLRTEFAELRKLDMESLVQENEAGQGALLSLVPRTLRSGFAKLMSLTRLALPLVQQAP